MTILKSFGKLSHSHQHLLYPVFVTEVHEPLYDIALLGKDIEPTNKCPGVPLKGKKKSHKVVIGTRKNRKIF